jgi:EpsI family protein
VIGRALAVIAIVIAMRVYTAHAEVDRPAPRVSLAQLPLQIDGWHGREDVALSPEIVEAAGVDDYVNRVYATAPRHAVSLYIGYYASQRQGDTIHSPQNCLPGAGWQAVVSARRSVSTGGAQVEVNDVLIQKGLDRAEVVYWYQGRGHTIASEYANKLWLMLDAARLHRTDGGLVRIIAPVVSDRASASADAVAFAGALVPHLTRELP